MNRALRVILLVAVLGALGGCAANNPNDPNDLSPAAIARAEAELASWHMSGSYYVPTSIEDLVARTRVIAIGRATRVGASYNGFRAGEFGDAGPDPDAYSISQAYEVEIERYLKGSGPMTINVGQKEGELPDGMQPTAARIKAARGKWTYTPIVVGSRYVFFLSSTFKVSERGNLEVWALAAIPGRILLKSDGNAEIENWPSRKELIDNIKPGQATALIGRIEKAIADNP